MNYRIPIIKLHVVRDSTCTVQQKIVTGSIDAYAICQSVLSGLDREMFIAIHLTTKHKVIAVEVVSIGSLSVAIVHPREVFKAALINNSSSIIIAHNHPSGSSTPSKEDFALTARLVDAGELLGVPVLDHIVYTDDTFYSFMDSGTLHGDV